MPLYILDVYYPADHLVSHILVVAMLVDFPFFQTHHYGKSVFASIVIFIFQLLPVYLKLPLHRR